MDAPRIAGAHFGSKAFRGFATEEASPHRGSAGDHGKEALNENPSQEEVVPKYRLTFYGGIFHFRQKFDDQEVPGSYLQTGASEHQCKYVRFIEFGDAPAGKQQVKGILESILNNMPVYFVDLTAFEDPVAGWLAAQASVIPSENKENIE